MGSWRKPVQGVNAEGKKVTAVFGQGKKEGHTLLSNGHKSKSRFDGKPGNRGHDHSNGKGGGTRRGRYTGRGS